MIRSVCPHCKTELQAPDEFAGQSAECPQCGHMLQVPKLPTAAKPAAPKPKPAAAPAASAKRKPAPPGAKPVAAAKPKPTAPGAKPAAAKPKPAAAPVRKSALAAELDSIASEALKARPKPKRSAAALTAAKPKGPAKPGKRKAPPSRRPPKRKRSHLDVYMTLLGLAAIGALAYFFLGRTLAKKKLDDSRAAVNAIIQQADQTYQEGDYNEYVALYQKALREARNYEKKFNDDCFRAKCQEIEEFLQTKQAQQEVWQILQTAEDARKGKKYVVAKRNYENVLKVATAYYETSKDTTMKQYLERAASALKSDDIRLGSQGYEYYNGKWVTAETKQRMIMAKRGMELYNGQWMKHDDVLKLKAAEQAKRVAAKARAIAKAATKKVAPKPKPKPRPKVPKMDPNADVWMFDDFEHGKIRWVVAGWGNPADLSLSKRGKSTELKVVYTKKGQDKCAIQTRQRIPMPLSSRDQLVMDVFNENKASFQLAIAFFTHGGGGFYETTGRNIKKGLNKGVMFDLHSKRFKCKETGWAYKSILKDPDAVNAFVLMIYPRSGGTAAFDNIRFVKKKKK